MISYWIVTIEDHEDRFPIVDGPYANGESQKQEIRSRRKDGKESFYLDIDCNGKPHMGRVCKVDGGKELA